MWGLAAASAYQAYNESASLGYAQTTWGQVSTFQIQPADAAKGFASSVNASIPSVCNGRMYQVHARGSRGHVLMYRLVAVTITGGVFAVRAFHAC